MHVEAHRTRGDEHVAAGIHDRDLQLVLHIVRGGRFEVLLGDRDVPEV